jgi:hypothetical protein
MKLLSTDGTALMEVSAIERKNDELIVKGKVFGTMPMTARLTPAEARQALKLLSFGTIVFLLTLPFRRSKH